MNRRILLLLSIFTVVFFSCDPSAGKKRSQVDEKPFVVHQPDALEDDIRENIETTLSDELDADTPRTTRFNHLEIVAAIYQQNDYHRLWSSDSSWHNRADSFYAMIRGAEAYGLYPEDYHYDLLTKLQKQIRIDRKNAQLWSEADMFLSDAFISFAHDLHLGRLPKDSITLKSDSLITDEFYRTIFAQVVDSTPRSVLEKLEPVHDGYKALKAALPLFLARMNRQAYTHIRFPKTDSLGFVRELQQRLFESNFIDVNEPLLDSTSLAQAVRKAQKQLGLTVDGKAGAQLVNKLNDNDQERFQRIALNLDRYKQLPDSMPVSYIMVNLPAYSLNVYDSGMVILTSKVIVGQPKTRTPLLNSKVTNMITYPQWTVPYSIIFKEMLPKIRKDVNYLKKENLMVVDRYDSVIDPATIDWNKLSKAHFPYLLRQRQGDDNSLGVIKFNFVNKFSVYMHDTNARSLFSKSSRALSHGCVRVQAWDSLSRFLLARDSANIPVDTLQNWLSRQEKHQVSLRRKLPVFFRYFTAMVDENGEIKFSDDIYFEDNYLIYKYLGRRF